MRNLTASLPVRGKVAAAFGAVGTFLVIFGVIALTTLSALRIGSDNYNAIVTAKDVTADVLPPPLYVVEANLVAYQLLDATGADLDTGIGRLSQLEDDFQTRLRHWDTTLGDTDELRHLLDDATAAGETFWDVIATDVIPALETGDTAAARAAVTGELQTAYNTHRDAVDAVVTVAVERVSSAETDAADAVADRTRIMIAVFAAALALTAAITWLLIRWITRSVAAVSAVAAQLANADLTIAAATSEGGDELAAMDRDLRNAVGVIRDALSAASGQVDGLADAAAELSAVSTQLGASANNSSTQAKHVATATTSMTTAVSSVAAAVEELSSSVEGIDQACRQAARVATDAGEAAKAAHTTVNRLSNSSQEISTIAHTISEIAEQTRLLALNATIEAAHAGAAGEGFAVVANEVKDLARETTIATRDIEAQLARIAADANDAVTVIGQIVDIVSEIVTSQTSIAAAVGQQSSAANEIARNVAHAAQLTGNISSNVAGVADAASSTADGSNSCANAANELAYMAAQLRAITARFTI